MSTIQAPIDLQAALALHAETIFKPRYSVLFRTGDPAQGVFVVRNGSVNLDFGLDLRFAQAHGPGALLGLPATLTGRPYCMSAIVAEDSELGFCSRVAFNSLLQKNPDLCQKLLLVLGEMVAEN